MTDKDRLDWLSRHNLRATENVPNGRREVLYVIADPARPNKLREQIDFAMSREHGQVEMMLEEFAKHHFKSRFPFMTWADLPAVTRKREIDATRRAFLSIRGR